MAGDPRIPPGQTRTHKWPVLHTGEVPPFDVATWRFELRGCVERPLALSWDELLALPRVRRCSDFHCVTGWSRLDNEWEGVAVLELARRAGVRPEARFALVGAEGGYTTNLPAEELLRDDVLLALRHDGRDLPPEHGGPLRLVVPGLYAWKSAKWVRSIEFLAEDRRGYWEERGYSSHGDPWTEERYA